MNYLQQQLQATFGLPPQELEAMASYFHKEEMQKDAFLVKTNGYCNKMCLLESGYMRIFAQSEDKEVTQWISRPGYFVMDIASYFFRAPARFSIQALCACTLYSLDYQAYQKLSEALPKWAALERQFLAKCFITLENRVFNHLSMNAEQRYDAFFKQQPELFNEIPLQYIASMLGMTPETFSRIRRKQIE